MALRPFRWLPHNGKRHAVPEHLVPNDEAATLCGEELVIPARRATSIEWRWATCVDCDTAWRRVERIPVLPCRRDTEGRLPDPWAHRPAHPTPEGHRSSSPRKNSASSHGDSVTRSAPFAVAPAPITRTAREPA